MDWQVVLSNIGSFAVGAGILAFLIQSLVKLYLSRDIEQFKARMQAAHDTELERLRADLRIVAFERETRFAKLHEKRADVIAELYRRIVAANRAMNELLSPIQMAGALAEGDREKEAAERGNAFLDYYLENQIYFDESLCDKLQSFNKELTQAWNDYLTYQSSDPEVARERRRTRIEAWKTLREKVLPIRREIENAFRELLGHQDTMRGQ